MTFPDRFKEIHLDACGSTNDYLKENIGRLEPEFPLMVSAAVQTAGRGRESRGWISPENLGLYVTFGFHLPDNHCLSLLPLTAGVAAADALASWTGTQFVLKWPNDLMASGRKVAGILCENIVAGETVSCLVGVGVNVNQREGDWPRALRGRAVSLLMLTGTAWPLAECGERLAASMVLWMQKLAAGRREEVMDRARQLSLSFLGREIRFHWQGRMRRGTFCGLAADGGLRLKQAGREEAIFYNGEIAD